MANRKMIEWARSQRQRMLRRREPAPQFTKPIVFPTSEPVAKPVLVPAVSGPKPEKKIDYRKPYFKKSGEYVCEVCGYTLKTEEGMVRHIEAKHPEVAL